jgi:hypothetical protein
MSRTQIASQLKVLSPTPLTKKGVPIKIVPCFWASGCRYEGGKNEKRASLCITTLKHAHRSIQTPSSKQTQKPEEFQLWRYHSDTQRSSNLLR